MGRLPHAPVRRIMKEAGAARVSDGAEAALAELLETHALRVTQEALKLMQHTGRTTLRETDIRMAADLLT